MKEIAMDERWLKGAVSVERKSDGWKPWRIPYEQVSLFPPNGLNGNAERASGVRLSLASDTRTIRIQVAAMAADCLFDCVVNDKLHETVPVAAGQEEIVFSGLPDGRNRIELWFPQLQAVTIRKVEMDADASAEPESRQLPRFVAYGSSITHGVCNYPPTPSRTWPALFARRFGLDATNLGFGGNCHLEPMAARLVRDLPADFISLCFGINVYRHETLSIRTFRSAVIGFIQLVREKHPDTPIAVISPIYCQPWETKDNAVGLSLAKMREEIEEAVKSLEALGDRRLYPINGLELLGESEAERIPDKVHPDPQGYVMMADRLAERLGGWFGKLPTESAAGSSR